MTIAVLGATGFVGRHLVDQLRSHGLKVRALSRSESNIPRSWSALGVEVVPLSLDANLETFKKALRGVTCIIHCAGNPTADGVDLRGYQLGSHTLATAALAENVERVILLSTVAVCEPISGSLVTSETVPTPNSDYARSRLQTEFLLHNVLDGSGTALIIVRVPAVIGVEMTGTVLHRFFQFLRAGVFIQLGSPNSSFPCVGVHRLAALLVWMTKSRGETIRPVYQFADNVLWTDLVRWYELASGKKLLRVRLPIQVVRLGLKTMSRIQIAGAIQALVSQTFYADDSKNIGWSPAGDIPHIRDEIESVMQLALSGKRE